MFSVLVMLRLVRAPLPSEQDLRSRLQFAHLVLFHTRAPVVSGRRCSRKALKVVLLVSVNVAYLVFVP